MGGLKGVFMTIHAACGSLALPGPMGHSNDPEYFVQKAPVRD
jgi:hypothetical protein